MTLKNVFGLWGNTKCEVLTSSILCLLWLVSPITPLPDQIMETKEMIVKSKVVIIGAGVSGLAAANRLIQNNFKDVTVLEAMDRIGGRVHYTLLDNNKGGVDLGGHWVHGEKGNTMYEIAQPLGLVNHSGDYENMKFFFSGGREAPFGDTDFYGLFDDLISGKEKFTEEDKKKTFEEYIHHKTEKILAPMNMPKEDVSAIKRHIDRTLCSLEACANLADVSMNPSDEFEEAEGDRLVEWKHEGMNNIIKLLMGTHEKSPWKGLNVESRVKLSTKVTKIDWSGDQVEVTTDKGDTFTADYVIFTPSLNVLKHTHKNLFNPPLPHDKVSVIEKLGMDAVDKIYLVFEKPWWPSGGSGFALLHTKAYPHETQDWGEDIMSFVAEHHNPHILGGWLIGEAAKQMEQDSDENVKSTAMRILRQYLPASYQIPDPIQVIRSSWWKNEFVRGSYSFPHVNANGIDHPRVILGTPLTNKLGKPVLLFAGEATNPNHYSTVHGALETGWREADRIIHHVTKNKK